MSTSEMPQDSPFQFIENNTFTVYLILEFSWKLMCFKVIVELRMIIQCGFGKLNHDEVAQRSHSIAPLCSFSDHESSCER